MSALPQIRFTPKQYLELERGAEFKSEYFDGQIVAMSGGTHRHALIIGNITAALWLRLKEQRCRVAPTEVKVRGLQRAYMYPDLVVTCGESQYADEEKDVLLNPLVIVEVLSPSTERYDRGLKWNRYKTIPSLQQYVLVSQTEPRIAIFTRQASGDWLVHDVLGLESSCVFESVKCEVPMSDVYYQIDFDPPEPAE